MVHDLPMVDTTCVQQAAEDFDSALSLHVGRAALLNERLTFALALPPSPQRHHLLQHTLLQLEGVLPSLISDDDEQLRVLQDIEVLLSTQRDALQTDQTLNVQATMAAVSPSWLLSEQAVVEHVTACLKPTQRPSLRAHSGLVALDRSARLALPSGLHRQAWQLPIGWWLGQTDGGEELEQLAIVQGSVDALDGPLELAQQDQVSDAAKLSLSLITDDFCTATAGKTS
jgi:hypothetical protein